jgi:Flavin containing amine oxidoreductase
VCGARMGNLPELAETGFCIYDLSRLQDEFRDSSGMAALEVDFFRADAMLQRFGTDDAAIAQFTLRAIALALRIDQPIDNLLLDVSVVRARNAVSHFPVGSASLTPRQVTLRPGRRGLYICGDWVDRTGHSSWSTEKSVVTGRQAAAKLAADFRLSLPQSATSIIPPAPDSPQLQAVRTLAKTLRFARGVFP